MLKNFNGWNSAKKNIQNRQNKFYHVRQIWWCTLGVNIGSEQDGVGVHYWRPVLIIKAINKTTCIVVPLTTSLKQRPFQVIISTVGAKRSTALVSQIRLIDTKRLVNRIDAINSETFQLIKKTVREMF